MPYARSRGYRVGFGRCWRGLCGWLNVFFLSGMPVVFAEDSYAKDYRYVRRHVTVLNMPMIDQLLAIREPKHSRPCVGYVGRVDVARGSLVTLEALRLLKQRGRTVGWHCVGAVDDGLQNEMAQRIAGSGLEDIHILGALPASEALLIIARCHIGLALLGSMPNYIESFPTKMFEYMALGLPVIASDFPLYRDVLEHCRCGICVDPQDARAVADAIERLLDNPDLARSMGEVGRQATIDHYNWDVERQKLLRFYEDCLGPKTPSDDGCQGN